MQEVSGSIPLGSTKPLFKCDGFSPFGTLVSLCLGLWLALAWACIGLGLHRPGTCEIANRTYLEATSVLETQSTWT